MFGAKLRLLLRLCCCVRAYSNRARRRAAAQDDELTFTVPSLFSSSQSPYASHNGHTRSHSDDLDHTAFIDRRRTPTITASSCCLRIFKSRCSCCSSPCALFALNFVLGILFGFLLTALLVSIAIVANYPLHCSSTMCGSRSVLFAVINRHGDADSLYPHSITQKSLLSDFASTSQINLVTPPVWNSQRFSERRSLPRPRILVCVMSAEKYLSTRALDVWRTWAHTIPGEVLFFAGGNLSVPELDGRVLRLPRVDDTYPPQKKSFMMLRYMFDVMLHRFDWFVRADDDVYVRGEALAELLARLNASEPLYIGQAGTGLQWEVGQLALAPGENFCMGGPGVVYSRELVRRLAPHLRECMQNLYTDHEDVEVGRCIRRFLGINCTAAYEMQSLFYQNYRNPTHSFNHSLLHSAHLQAITLHPVKDSSFQHRLHNFYLLLRLQEARTRQLKLLYKQKLLSNYVRRSFINEFAHSRRIAAERFTALQRTSLDAESLLQEDLLAGDDEQHSWREHQSAPVSAAYANEQQRRRERPAYSDAYTYAWHSFDGAGRFYSKDALVPRLAVPAHLKLALHLLVDSTMLELNRDARQRLRVLDYKSTNYGYALLHPTRGFYYVLDLLLNYRAFKQVPPMRQAVGSNHNSSLPPPILNSKPRLVLSQKLLVRKHSYFVQRFVPLKLLSSQSIETPDFEIHSVTEHVPSLKVKDEDVQSSDNHQNTHPNTPSPARANSSARIANARPSIPFMHLIVAVSGRTTAFHRFLRNFEVLVLRPVFDVRDSPTTVTVNSSSSHFSATSLSEVKDAHFSSELDAAHSSSYSAVELAELSRTGLVVVSVGPPEELRPLHALMARFPRADLRLVHEPRAHNLTRAAMLNVGALAVRARSPSLMELERDPSESEAKANAKDPLLVFVDVDIAIDAAALRRLRMHPARGRRTYFPIVLSQHEPNFLSALDRSRTLCNQSSHSYNQSTRAAAPLAAGAPGRTHYWRQFGFGICSMYYSDFFALGTWDERIVGWGLEDIELFERVLRGGKLTAFRAPDAGLRHVYHRVSCSTGASSEGFQASSRVQVRMCVGSRLANAASGATLLALVERFSRAHCPPRTNCTRICSLTTS